MMNKKSSKAGQLVEKHGSLADFKKAVRNAANNLMITESEAVSAIKRYETELNEAIREDEETSSNNLIDISELRRLRDSKKKDDIIKKLLVQAEKLNW